MEIESADTPFKKVSYNDSSYKKWVEYLRREIDKKAHHLCLFLGLYAPHKKQALKQLSSELNREVRLIDANDLVSQIETETYKKLDELFSRLHQSEDIIYLKNGSRLCGTYTGFSRSRVKYATPQERYFLKKVKAFNGLVIVDVDEYNDADSTMRRAATSIISFNLPDSKWKQFIWHFKNFNPNGSVTRSKRPEAYGDIG